MVAPGMAALTRYAENLQVPRAGKASVNVQAELGSWVSIKRAREIRVPPQGFYLATLSNGTAVTVINGEEKLRKAGEIWAVSDGQSMTVKIQNKRQENGRAGDFLAPNPALTRSTPQGRWGARALGSRSIALSHQVVLCIAQFPRRQPRTGPPGAGNRSLFPLR